VRIVKTDDVIKVGVLGDLDCASVPRLRQVLGRVIGDPREVVVDLRWTAENGGPPRPGSRRQRSCS
jgi:hypothetical protein